MKIFIILFSFLTLKLTSARNNGWSWKALGYNYGSPYLAKMIGGPAPKLGEEKATILPKLNFKRDYKNHGPVSYQVLGHDDTHPFAKFDLSNFALAKRKSNSKNHKKVPHKRAFYGMNRNKGLKDGSFTWWTPSPPKFRFANNKNPRYFRAKRNGINKENDMLDLENILKSLMTRGSKENSAKQKRHLDQFDYHKIPGMENFYHDNNLNQGFSLQKDDQDELSSQIFDNMFLRKRTGYAGLSQYPYGLDGLDDQEISDSLSDYLTEDEDEDDEGEGEENRNENKRELDPYRYGPSFGLKDFRAFENYLYRNSNPDLVPQSSFIGQVLNSPFIY